MDKRLLDILCCPVSKTPLRLLGKPGLEALNKAIREDRALTVAGVRIAAPVAEALITVDHKLIYRIEDDIPVMLPEEGIGTAQFSDFPVTG